MSESSFHCIPLCHCIHYVRNHFVRFGKNSRVHKVINAEWGRFAVSYVVCVHSFAPTDTKLSHFLDVCSVVLCSSESVFAIYLASKTLWDHYISSASSPGSGGQIFEDKKTAEERLWEDIFEHTEVFKGGISTRVCEAEYETPTCAPGVLSACSCLRGRVCFIL